MHPFWLPLSPPQGIEEPITTENLQEMYRRMTNKQIKCGSDGFIQLIDHMGSDQSICNAARVSYGNHKTNTEIRAECASKVFGKPVRDVISDISLGKTTVVYKDGTTDLLRHKVDSQVLLSLKHKDEDYYQGEKVKDTQLIRYLMSHQHTTPFEMVEFVFLIRAPIHVVRQWHRHRMWSYNEYSMRYKPAIDSIETTEPDKWRLQATNNKQGSDGHLSEWPADFVVEQDEVRHKVYNPDGELIVNNTIGHTPSPGEYLTQLEDENHEAQQWLYKSRLALGVAKEQARKDLPLSNYTEFYAKTDLHNLFHFLGLRMDSHAQLEVRQFANAISEIIKPLIPIAYKAFEDYRLNGCHFSAMEMELIKDCMTNGNEFYEKPDTMTDREWSAFLAKVG